MNQNELVCYSTDASRLIGSVEKVFFPETIEEVLKIVKENNNIAPRGGGSNSVGSCVPNNSVVVDMRKMNKITGFNNLNKTVWAESGITIKELNEKLSSVNYEFPISFRDISTIGGMIAMNYLGDKNLGSVKDWVEELEFVNGKGELIKSCKADMSDVCGMEGTTGIIIKAKLKLMPMYNKSFSIFQSNNIEEIMSVAKKLRAKDEINILKLYPPFVSKLLGFPSNYHLIIGFDSEQGKIKGKDYEKILGILKKDNNALYSEGYYNNEDAKFFLDRLKEFILFLEDNEIPYLAELGIGVINPFFKDSEENKREKTIDLIKKIGGKKGRYGIGLKRKYLLEPIDKKIIQRVKLRHDPFNKFNTENSSNYLSLDSKGTWRGFSEFSVSKISNKPSPLGDGKTQEIFDKFNLIDSSKTKIELIEKVFENSEVEPLKKEASLLNTEDEIKKRILDYEETYSSEIQDDKRKVIEKFAKDVPLEIIKKDEIGTMSDNLDRKPMTSSKSEKDYINKIITNRLEKKDENKSEKLSDKKNDS